MIPHSRSRLMNFVSSLLQRRASRYGSQQAQRSCERDRRLLQHSVLCVIIIIRLAFPTCAFAQQFFCSQTSVTGRLSLELSQLRFSRIIFQYSHRPVSARNLAPDPRNLPIALRQPVVYFSRDFRAVDIFVEEPDSSELQHRKTGSNRHDGLTLTSQ